MLKVKVSSKNQIVIPAEAREKLGIGPGDSLLIEVREPTMVISREPEDYLEALRNSGRGIWGIDSEEWLRKE